MAATTSKQCDSLSLSVSSFGLYSMYIVYEIHLLFCDGVGSVRLTIHSPASKTKGGVYAKRVRDVKPARAHLCVCVFMVCGLCDTVETTYTKESNRIIWLFSHCCTCMWYGGMETMLKAELHDSSMCACVCARRRMCECVCLCVWNHMTCCRGQSTYTQRAFERVRASYCY